MLLMLDLPAMRRRDPGKGEHAGAYQEACERADLLLIRAALQEVPHHVHTWQPAVTMRQSQAR